MVVPEDVRHQFALSEPGLADELVKMTDHLTLDLFTSGVPESQIVRAPVSRLVVDVERFEDDELEPAKMSVSYLLIDPLQVLPGQEVVVSGNVCNQGEERGTKTVSLSVNGVAEQSQTVGVSGGSCQQVTFRLSRAVPGTYQVAIDGMTGTFSVLAPRTVTGTTPSQQDTGLGTAGIIVIIALAIALIAALIFLFRR